MAKTINESDMAFGPYPDDDCFELEKSACYKKINEGAGGIKIPEFALLFRNADSQIISINLVEAKTNAPREHDVFIEDIRQKLNNGICLILGLKLGRHPDHAEDLPQGFRQLNLREEIKLILVVKNHQAGWLPPLHDKLTKALKPIIKTLNLKPNCVKVFNEEKARQNGLIQQAV